MIILGIDPGTATTGFGIIEANNDTLKALDYGHIETPKNTPLPERISQISTDLKYLINKWQPNEFAIEELFFSKNVKTAMSVAHARGSIIQTASEQGYKINEYKPNTVKLNICGDGKADKKQMQKMVQLLLNLQHPPKPDDAADALAIAICHYNMLNYNHLKTL